MTSPSPVREKLNIFFNAQEHVRKVRRLAIVTTDQCQTRCAHCLMKSGPKETAQLTLEKMLSAIDFFIEKVRSV